MLSGKLSGLEGYMLGRMAEQHHHEIVDVAQRLTARLSAGDESHSDVALLSEENARLREELAAAHDRYRQLEAIYDRLDAWATGASDTLKKHGLIRE